MKRLFIIHGYMGYPEENWFPWLKAEAEKLGFKVIVPAMPTPNIPILDGWLDCIRENVGQLDDETFLVGHSLGCPTILRYLESLQDDQKAGGILLVAGFAEPLPVLPEIDDFTDGSWDYEKIKSHTSQIASIISDNDPYVPLSIGKAVTDKFGGQMTVLKGAAHINKSAGFIEAPVVLDELKRLTGNS